MNKFLGAQFTMVVLSLAACGKVQAVADATVDTGLPDALSCPTTQEACGSVCSDLKSSATNCGACGVSCQTERESCMAGHCVDFTSSCAAIKAANAAATTGPYTLLDNSVVFCDMEHAMTYTALAFGQYNAAHPGYDMVSLADLMDPSTQKAFIYLFNRQGGSANSLGTFTSTTCCFKVSANVGMSLELGGSYLYPATPNSATPQCNQTGGYTLPSYGFELVPGSVFTTATLDDAFFSTHPPTEVAICSDGTNPAFFWKRHAST